MAPIEVPNGNPITQLIASFMEDPEARDARYAEHVYRVTADCKKLNAMRAMPYWKKDAWQPKTMGMKLEPGYPGTSAGTGAITRANTLDTVIAFHTKQAQKAL